ncbi:MAG: tRNA (cytidine(34)-2'-O)-methyltransferase [Pseudomonadota bacterium]
MRIALYQPDIPGNTGTIARMCACLGLPLDIIEPTGFRFDDASLRRAGLDYLERAAIVRHADWTHFLESHERQGRRLVLLTTTADLSYTDFEYSPQDTLLFGRESAGAPDHVHQKADARLCIPMATTGRSLNLAISAAIVAGEAVRQVGLVNYES